MRALSMIRAGLNYRREIFEAGLTACGYKVTYMGFVPTAEDVLIIWNRYGHYGATADDFERVGATVLVVENGYLGKNYKGGDWYAISKGHHNGAGQIPSAHAGLGRRLFFETDCYINIGDSSNSIICRKNGEIVGLPQRGIGEQGVAMPRNFTTAFAKHFPKDNFRMRPHPAKNKNGITLEDDLKNARAVFTWGSGAALKAICMGIPCVHFFKDWIGAPASTYYKDLETWDNVPYIDPAPMLARLSWAMWSGEEIRAGLPFKELL